LRASLARDATAVDEELATRTPWHSFQQISHNSPSTAQRPSIATGP
jgi:hypothetical protein